MEQTRGDSLQEPLYAPLVLLLRDEQLLQTVLDEATSPRAFRVEWTRGLVHYYSCSLGVLPRISNRD